MKLNDLIKIKEKRELILLESNELIYKKYGNCFNINTNNIAILQDEELTPLYLELKKLENKVITHLYSLISTDSGQDELTRSINNWAWGFSQSITYQRPPSLQSLANMVTNSEDVLQFAIYLTLVLDKKDAKLAKAEGLKLCESIGWEPHGTKDWYLLKDAVCTARAEGIELDNDTDPNMVL